MKVTHDRMAAALGCLIGLPCWGYGRALNMLMLDFGARHPRLNRRGEPYDAGDYALHVESRWRLRGPSGIVTGSSDRYWPAGVALDDVAGRDWDGDGAARCDERFAAYFRARSSDPIVEAVEIWAPGGFSLQLSDAHFIEAFTDHSRAYEDWRLFRPGAPDERHFVVTMGKVGQDVTWVPT